MSESLEDRLVRHEGLRLRPYRDTVGKLTIGVGRNLDDVGLSEVEARSLLANDIQVASAALRRALPWTDALDPVRREVLIEMAFNLGVTRLLGFRNTLAAVQAGDYAQAADGMLDSAWAGQVGARATELVNLMRRGG